MTGKKVAILQSNYIPWKGYFDLINRVDEFIIFDDAQYTKNDWRNRNRIKTQHGSKWITIPVPHKGKSKQKIREVVVQDRSWRGAHWKSISYSYAKAQHFKDYQECFQSLYLESDENELSKINYAFIKTICELLGITTKISWSMDYQLIKGQTERLVHLCQQAGATEYLSGPAAQGYIEPAHFEQANITLSYVDYSAYPEYEQRYPPFDHFVTILDLIFNEGSNAPKYMKSF